MSNLHLWNSVCTTDPNSTKRVNQRGGFTAIDAYSQIQKATETFGPAGVGWGWEIKDFQYLPNDTMVAHIRLWHKDGAGFDVCGQASLYSGRDRHPDNDCAKKALTDAITKGLSYLGFNADVFLGKFDDNKYVESLHREGARQGDVKGGELWGGPLKKSEFQEEIRKFSADLAACTDLSSLEGLLESSKDLLDQCQRDAPNWWHTKEGSDVIGLSDRIAEVRKHAEETAKIYAEAGLGRDGEMIP